MTLEIDPRRVAARLGLLRGLVGLRQFLDRGARQQLLELGATEFQIGACGVEFGRGAVQCVGRCQAPLAHLANAFQLGATKLEVARRAFHAGPRGFDLRAAGAPRQLREARLRLCQRGLGLCESCSRSP
ncbi:MAG: hypothetical protein P8X94_15380 [Woeseiaceae bacterium]